jgi:hypothetical protein
MYLGATSGILRSTTGEVLGGVLGGQVLVDGHVLLLGEDGIVLLKLVLVEDGLVTAAD